MSGWDDSAYTISRITLAITACRRQRWSRWKFAYRRWPCFSVLFAISRSDLQYSGPRGDAYQGSGVIAPRIFFHQTATAMRRRNPASARRDAVAAVHAYVHGRRSGKFMPVERHTLERLRDDGQF